VVVVSDAVFYGGGQPLSIFELGRAVRKKKQREDAEFGEKKKGRRARSSRLPWFPFRGSPVSLTEGGWPVVCWPGYETPAERKKFHMAQKKAKKIFVEN
jgi:hypothetical protein